MKQNSFVIKGDICYSADKKTLLTFKDHYLICLDGNSAGVFENIPEEYSKLEIHDYSGLLVVPGLVDLHIHAPQFTLRGLGMDDELLDWLNNLTFPEESRYSDMEYARAAYTDFAEVMRLGATTRACIFGTTHVPATELLMEYMEATGLHTYVGKVNMDRNCPAIMVEDTGKSVKDTEEWINFCKSRGFLNTKPMLTPRFIPTCSDKLMQLLREIQEKYALPLQSHLSENPAEIEWVKELCKESKFYGDAYDSFKLFGRDVPTIMAHCVYSEENELSRIKENGVFIAHCPQSNTNIASGIAPVRKFLDMGINCGLGSDVAGGASESILRAMADAIQMSKMRWRLQDKNLKPLTFEEVFFLGTKGGGEFFGRVGSFEKGYEFDAVVFDDAVPSYHSPLTLRQRLERHAYLSNGRGTAHKFVCGTQIF
ncbi:MAG: guanine deaminase [Firmicutes bacterium HGW-Firmicutes-16]|nr:MAG: guanine deaminase [Firmicutes bacterium HGW-Firmicutes-16]